MAKKTTAKPSATVGNRGGAYDRRERIARGLEIMATEKAKQNALVAKKRKKATFETIFTGDEGLSAATRKKYLVDSIQEHATGRKVAFEVADLDYELAKLEERMVKAECPKAQLEALRSGDLQLSKTLLFDLTGTPADELVAKIRKLLAEQL